MFLSTFGDLEKQAFLQLAHKFASADGNVSESEMQMISQYCHEMSVDINSFSPTFATLEECTKVFIESTTRNIVLIEILALVYADGDYSESENELMQELKNLLIISEDSYKAFKDWVKQINNIYQEGLKLIHATK